MVEALAVNRYLEEERDPLTPPYTDMVFGAPVENQNTEVEELRQTIITQQETIRQKNRTLVRSALCFGNVFFTSKKNF